jgi:MoaA/NifB/PqqE/SkfB family radical SAM enzyme
MDSGERDAGEMPAEEFRRAIDLLAGMGVFHIALGGGEALERPDFFELASYVRAARHRPQSDHQRSSS